MVSPGSRGTWLSILLEYGWIWRIRLQRCYLYLSNNGDLEQKTTLSTCRLRHDDVAKAGWSTSKGMLKQHEEMWDEDGRRCFFLKKREQAALKIWLHRWVSTKNGFSFPDLHVLGDHTIFAWCETRTKDLTVSFCTMSPRLGKAIAPLEERVPTAFKVDPNKVTDVFFSILMVSLQLRTNKECLDMCWTIEWRAAVHGEVDITGYWNSYFDHGNTTDM